ncbi:competence protein CoiA [Priestia endophytica]|uniref:Competence protein CoiA n=1 Tax=Priestia endophytica DSM 13796 TaxID=1121089 RepID=A0A1I6C0A1_9BACI|nr:competence protein CoiA family protein [Priestia endophytica]KYG33442.1 hypothetical protein AZF06_21600 [Priestia endophytica]SFQ86620.1 competence protein CoiA [Priestia endophytica DSM 13796]
MLRCITDERKTIIATKCDRNSTKRLNEEKKLYCPHCESHVQFRAGTKRTWYFAHVDSECSVYSEPETEAHKKGKKILYNWLRKKFPSAEVEYEYHISEIKQIADVFIIHKEGELEGKRWAFEFQHSPLSKENWEERHEGYKSANIQDFWFLDKKFMKFSTSPGKSDARLIKELERAIFSRRRMCYFLEPKSKLLTIDFKFRSSWERPIANGKERPRQFFYHDPIHHSIVMDEVEIITEDTFLHTILSYDVIKEDLKTHLDEEILPWLRGEESQRLERELRERYIEKIEFAESNFEREIANVFEQFMRSNNEKLENDIRTLSSEDFFNKYNSYAKKVQQNSQEFDSFKDTDDITVQYIKEYNYTFDFYNISFLNEQGEKSLEEYLKKKNEKEIDLVSYVYENYSDVLTELRSRHMFRKKEIINKKLREIKSSLAIYSDRPTLYDFAFTYRRCKDKEEIDMYIKQIKETILNNSDLDDDPFKDIW